MEFYLMMGVGGKDPEAWQKTEKVGAYKPWLEVFQLNWLAIMIIIVMESITFNLAS